MNARCATIVVSVVAWSGVLLVATYRSHTSAVFGQYSWGQVTLLSFLLYTAVMAEHLAKDIVSYWITQSFVHWWASPREETMSRARSRVIELNTFVRKLAWTLSEGQSYLVGLFLSCKRLTRSLMSSGSHP
jgi:hypothetical protein